MRSCLIFDPNPYTLLITRQSLERCWPQAMYFQARTLAEACEHAQSRPAICLASFSMPSKGIIASLKEISGKAPHMKVFAICSDLDDALLLALVAQGVPGISQQNCSGHILNAALQLVLAGGRYFPPRLADLAQTSFEAQGMKQVAKPLGESATGVKGHEPVAFTRITQRQHEVLKLASAGRSNKQIAQSLGVSPSTIKTHIENLMCNLGAQNRTALSARAMSLQMI